MIPKILHQTYSDSQLPPVIMENIVALKERNPDWVFKFYDEYDRYKFIVENYAWEVVKAYNSINPLYGAARADLFRYLVVYKYGGIYMDIKSSASRPLTEIISDHSYLLSHWDHSKYPGWGMHSADLGDKLPDGELQQWYIASEPSHPFLASVILNVLDNIKKYTVESVGSGSLAVLRTTGPIAYSKSIIPLMNCNSYCYKKTNDEFGFIYNVYEKDIG